MAAVVAMGSAIASAQPADPPPQQDKIERALAYFEQDCLAELASRFDIAAIGLACALGYLDLRQPQLGWRERFPGLAGWFADVSQRPSMQATLPR